MGTHMDAPSHFIKGSWRLHEIPMERFSGPAVVVDISARAERDADAEVTKGDLLAWEQAHGRIPDGAVVIMNSGWGRRFGPTDRSGYLGIPAARLKADPGDFSDMHHPGFGAEAARWLTEERDVAGVAVDTISVDPGASTTFAAHLAMLGKRVWVIENAANVDRLSPAGHTVFAVPYNVRDGSGAPVRAFAIRTDLLASGGGSVVVAQNASIIVLIGLVSALLS